MTTTEDVTPTDDRKVLAGEMAFLLATGFALRHVARAGRTVLPAPLVQAAVAGAGTWALAKAIADARDADRRALVASTGSVRTWT